jgi:carbonic anhydrase
MDAGRALERLREGNSRFVSAVAGGASSASRPMELVTEQEPFAIILGCSDSRVPAELVFDQGLGDLFVIRVAGNIAEPSQIGSVEFAASRFGTRLVVVLGHSMCGAIVATLEELTLRSENRSPNLRAIVDRVQPSVESLLVDGYAPDALIEHAVRANVRASVDHLKNRSETLKGLIAHEGLMIVGAEYSIHNGEVEFFDE